MCGITGFLGSAIPRSQAFATVERMVLTLKHRGPDAAGIWVDETVGVALGHRRLAIVELSSEGAQPMVSHNGRYVLIFNGEIYNHRQLRTEILNSAGIPFRGHSDTEVLLAAIQLWGLKTALERSVGMFALALWDKAECRMSLARDRLGEKPLYYGMHAGKFLFGSELKALRVHPDWNVGIDRDALAQLLRYNYIPAPRTIYQGIYKLPPGCFIELTQNNGAWSCSEPTKWWSFQQTFLLGKQNLFQGNDEDAVDELDSLLRKTLSDQSIADVPLGAFLSGGIDSTAVVSILQSLSETSVRTFTIGYDDTKYDESQRARKIAAHLGTEHNEWIITSSDALEVIPQLPIYYDEPFADASQIPTALISRFAKEQVTVALSGDGGDEMFGGYNRHIWGPDLWSSMSRYPGQLRTILAGGVKCLSPAAWDRLFVLAKPLLPNRYVASLPGEKIHKMAAIMDSCNERELYSRLVRAWPDPVPVIGGVSGNTADSYGELWQYGEDFAHQMMALDTLTYLPDDILVKMDRAAMAASLESRIPYLDHRIVEFAASLPLHYKIRCGQGKWILRTLLERYVPRQLMNAPKSGFAIPIHEWLRGPLRDWAESLLDERRLSEEGYFDPDAIRRVWQQHLSGRRNTQYLLWSVLMFQAWLEAQE